MGDADASSVPEPRSGSSLSDCLKRPATAPFRRSADRFSVQPGRWRYTASFEPRLLDSR